MGRRVSGFLPTPPPTVTHNDLVVRRGGGHAFVGKSDRLRDAEERVAAHLARIAPAMPLAGPLRVTLRYCFATGGRHAQGEPHLQAPDVDNTTKSVLDLCVRCGLIADDRLVCDLRAAKAWSDPAGIYVLAEELA